MKYVLWGMVIVALALAIFSAVQSKKLMGVTMDTTNGKKLTCTK